jgi:hypothetical protein
MLPLRKTRAHAALQRITSLYAEQQAIYRNAFYRPSGLSHEEKTRLDEIACEIALAQDERNRARCGAAPRPSADNPAPPPSPPIHARPQSFPREKSSVKTNVEEVREIRRLYTEEKLSTRQIRQAFPHLKDSTIRDILKNRTWHDPAYVPGSGWGSREHAETRHEQPAQSAPLSCES